MAIDGVGGGKLGALYGAVQQQQQQRQPQAPKKDPLEEASAAGGGSSQAVKFQRSGGTLSQRGPAAPVQEGQAPIAPD